MEKEKVLVTGGAGFIGSSLIRHLSASHREIHVFDNFSVGKREHIPASVKVIEGDITHPSDHRRLDNQYDVVYHLAAIHFIPFCNAHPKRCIDVNVQGSQCLIDYVSEHPPQKLFFASTAAVYGPSDNLHREDDLPQPMDIYGVSKLAGEHMFRNFSKATGVPVIAGRLFNAYGPRETNAHLIPHIISQLNQQSGKTSKVLRLGNLKPYRDYVFVDDISSMIQTVTDQAHAAYDAVNVGSGSEYSVQEVVSLIGNLINADISIESDPKLQRKVERMHLRPNMSKMKEIYNAFTSRTLAEGLTELLKSEYFI